MRGVVSCFLEVSRVLSHSLNAYFSMPSELAHRMQRQVSPKAKKYPNLHTYLGRHIPYFTTLKALIAKQQLYLDQ